MHIRVEGLRGGRILNPDAQAWEKRIQGWEVDFSSPYGSGHGILIDDEPPQRFADYDVELSIEMDFTWGRDIVPVSATIPAISVDSDAMTLRGMLESVDDEGHTVIRFGSSLVSIQTIGSPPERGRFIQMEFETALLYPYSI